MPRPLGTIGETKLKILAIIYYNEAKGTNSYGYNIWKTLKETFHLYLDEGYSRNVYRHLKDLNELGLVKNDANQTVQNAPKRQLYTLTNEGKKLRNKFDRYFQILEKNY